jgi:hypothetical protein
MGEDKKFKVIRERTGRLEEYRRGFEVWGNMERTERSR